MFRKHLHKRRSPRPFPPLSRLANDLRFYWHSSSKAPWIVAMVLCAGIAGFAFLAQAMSARAFEHRQLNCLALNVYYESRGEPLAGMHAVAEVTMNRVASRRYPATVCEVVYEKRWDRLRKRDVGAFSWTEFDFVPHPEGRAWQQARDVAHAAFHRLQPPVLGGALHYHASHIRPSWAKGRKPVARIGAHVFYR
jgi:N-acetylmuramoyl-L-alanine amidase